MKRIFFLVLAFIPLLLSSQNLDSVEYYSYIDTIQMQQKLDNLSLPGNEKQWLSNYYKFNFFAVQKNYPLIERTFKLIRFDSLFTRKYSEKYLATKFWYHSIMNHRDTLISMYKNIISSNNYSKRLKINILNTLSYYYSNFNLILSSKLLNVAIMMGLKDSLPELYRSFLNLSGIYFAFSFAEEGKKTLEKGKKFKKGNTNPILDYLYIHNEAIFFMHQKQYDLAIASYWKTYQFFKKYHIPEYFAGAIINLARQYSYKNEIDSSLKVLYANHSFVLKNEYRLSPNFLSRYYWLLSDMYYKKNQFDSSEFYILKAIQIAEKYQFTEALADLYQDQATLVKRRNIEEAYRILEKAFNFKTLIAHTIYINFSNENTHKIKLLENNIKLNEYERNLIQTQLQYHQLQNRNRYIYTIIAFAIILLALYMRILYLRRIQKLKQQHTRDMIMQHEKTLQRISNELHDNIASSLNIFKKNLSNEQNQNELQHIIDEVRELSHLSYPSYLLHLPYQDTIESMLHKIETTTPHSIIKEISPQINQLNDDIKIQLYRILQELLNNTIKYHEKTTIKITLFIANNNLIFKYEDFDFNNKNKDLIKGFGLNSIEQRCQLIDAKFKYYFRYGFKFKLNVKL